MLSASSLLAACGGNAKPQSAPPHLPKSSATQLIALAQTVARDARGDGCTSRSEIDALSAKAHELVANGSVPLRLREPLLNGVTALAAEAPVCTPPAPPPTPAPKHDKPHKPHHDHGHHGGD